MIMIMMIMMMMVMMMMMMMMMTNYLNIGGAPPCAGKRGDGFGNTAGVLRNQVV